MLTAGALRHQRSYVAAHTRTHRQANRRERTQARRYARAHTEGMRKGDRETDKETTQNELKAVSTVGSCVPHTGRHLARWPLYLCRDTEETRQETPLDREVHTEVVKAHTHAHTHAHTPYRRGAGERSWRGARPLWSGCCTPRDHPLAASGHEHLSASASLSLSPALVPPRALGCWIDCVAWVSPLCM